MDVMRKARDMGGTQGGREGTLLGEDEPCYPHHGALFGHTMDRMAECQEQNVRDVVR